MASGYLIVTRFEVLYERAIQTGRFDPHPVLTKAIYGIPHSSRPALGGDCRRYRGIDREPLNGVSIETARLIEATGVPCEANRGTELLEQVEIATGREDGWVTDREDARRIWEALENERQRYEVIFGRELGDEAEPPPEIELLGYDAAYFVSDHFSCICDALFFPRWHGTDPEGVLFREYFEQLNRNGLFSSNDQALDYLRYYLSFDWTERADNFTSIEVYSVLPVS